MENGLTRIRHCFCSEFRYNYPLSSHVTFVCLRLKEAGLVCHMAPINGEPESTRMERCTPVEYQIKDGEKWTKVFYIHDNNNKNNK